MFSIWTMSLLYQTVITSASCCSFYNTRTLYPSNPQLGSGKEFSLSGFLQIFNIFAKFSLWSSTGLTNGAAFPLQIIGKPRSCHLQSVRTCKFSMAIFSQGSGPWKSPFSLCTENNRGQNRLSTCSSSSKRFQHFQTIRIHFHPSLGSPHNKFHKHLNCIYCHMVLQAFYKFLKLQSRQ